MDKTLYIMRCLLVIIFSLLILPSYGQSIKALEQELREAYFNSTTIKQKAYKIFQLDPCNETAVRSLIFFYHRENQLDSITAFFLKLKSELPRNPKVYYLSAKYQNEDVSLKDTSGLKDLWKAIELDSNYTDAQYLLGSSYYRLFHEKQGVYYATQCQKHFIKAGALDSQQLIILKYPIIQTSCYLGDSILVTAYRNINLKTKVNNAGKPLKGNWYFPINSFLAFKHGWECDFSLDVKDKIEMALLSQNWYSEQLYALDEPALYNQTAKTVYRLTWLRTFHNPVAVRIEKTGTQYMLYWKVCNGAGGYNPGKLTINKSKEISEQEWNIFISKLQAAHFNDIPVKADNIGSDGSEWIIEGMDDNHYHIAYRWTPRGTDFQKCGLYLIKLTGLKIKPHDIY